MDTDGLLCATAADQHGKDSHERTLERVGTTSSIEHHDVARSNAPACDTTGTSHTALVPVGVVTDTPSAHNPVFSMATVRIKAVYSSCSHACVQSCVLHCMEECSCITDVRADDQFTHMFMSLTSALRAALQTAYAQAEAARASLRSLRNRTEVLLDFEEETRSDARRKIDALKVEMRLIEEAAERSALFVYPRVARAFISTTATSRTTSTSYYLCSALIMSVFYL